MGFGNPINPNLSLSIVQLVDDTNNVLTTVFGVIPPPNDATLTALDSILTWVADGNAFSVN